MKAKKVSNQKNVKVENKSVESPVVQAPAPEPRPDRCPTGIPGFDELVEGGFPKGKKILIEGKAGTGKSIFGLQYLYNGATKYNEPGLYLSFEQKDVDLKEQAKQFGWDLDAAGIDIYYKSPSNLESIHEILQILYDKFEKKGIKRLVIDSLPALYINATNVTFDKPKPKGVFSKEVEGKKLSPKNFLYLLLDTLRFVPVSTLLITEDTEAIPEFGFTPEYICDGVLKINLEPIGEYTRNIIIKKMRYTKNATGPQPMEMSPNGLIIHPQ